MEKGNPVTITFAVPGQDRALYEPLAEAFHQQNSAISVQIVEMDDTSLAGAASADTSLFPGPLPAEAATSFRDLQPLLDADSDFDQADFFPGALDTCRDSTGGLFGVPLYIYIDVIFYDRQAFEQAGVIHPQPGWTYAEFQDIVTRLAGRTGESVRYGYADSSTLAGSVLAPLVLAHLDERDGEVQAVELQADLQWYFDLVRTQALFPLQGSRDRLALADWEALFQPVARVGMWSGNLAEQLPGSSASLNDPYAGMALKTFGLAPFPIAPDRGLANTTPAVPQCLAISVGSAQPQAAWAWIRFLSDNQETIQIKSQADRVAKVPARQSAARASGYWKQLPDGAEAAVRYALEHAWTNIPYPQVFTAIETALTSALRGEADLTTAWQSVVVAAPQPTTAPVAVAPPEPTRNVLENAVKIRFYSTTNSMDLDQAIRAAIDAFQRDHPDITVELGTDFTLPDTGVDDMTVYLNENYDCYTWYRSRWTQKPEHLLSLEALASAEDQGFLNDFAAEQITAYRYEGELFGLPAASQPWLMSFNLDLLEKRGLAAPTADWTFADFLEMASVSASNTAGDRSYGFLYNPRQEILFPGQGIAWADLNVNPPVAKFTQPEVIDTLRWIAGLARDGVLLVQGDDQFQAVQEAVLSGQVAFWISQAGQDDFWFFTSGGKAPYPLGQAPLPKAPGGGSLLQSAEQGMFISSRSETPQACWTLIKYLSEQPGLYPGLPARRSVAQSAAWEEIVGPETAAVYRRASEQGEQAEASSPIGRPLEDWSVEAILAAINGEDPAVVAAAIQQKAETYLSCLADANWTQMDGIDLQEQVQQCEQTANASN